MIAWRKVHDGYYEYMDPLACVDVKKVSGGKWVAYVWNDIDINSRTADSLEEAKGKAMEMIKEMEA